MREQEISERADMRRLRRERANGNAQDESAVESTV
jgi:hypothetical protein